LQRMWRCSMTEKKIDEVMNIDDDQSLCNSFHAK